VDLGGLDLPKGGDMIAALGIQGVNPSGINAPGGPSFQTDDNIVSFWPSGKWNNRAKTFSVEDSLSYQVGRHLWKFGGDISAYRSATENAPNYGSFSFTGMFTGSSFADFLLGLPATSQRSDPLTARTITAKELGFYVMDTFKLTPRLTLDYGLRWDYYSLPTYTDGLMYNFDMATGQVVVPKSKLSQVNPAYTVPVVTGQAVPDADLGNFRPRISASYLIGKGFVIRGGYGQFTERFGHDYTGQAANQGAGPFERLSETFYNTNTAGQPLFSFPNPFPSNVNGQNVPGSWVVALPNHWENGTIHQYNASLEKELSGIGLRASYVGSRSRGLNYMWWKNENIPGNPWNFTTISELYPYHHDGAANYDALQVEGSRKQGWFIFDAHYTYAKNRNNIEQTDDVLHPTSIWGPQGDVHDQMLTFTTRWDLPFGRGRGHLNNVPKVVDAFLGGWAIQTISTFGSGTHLTPHFWGFDPANNNYNSSLPDLIPGANPNLPSDQRTAERWYNTPVYSCSDPQGCGLGFATPYAYSQIGAFKVPGCPDSDPLCLNTAYVSPGRFGNAKPGIIDGPGINVHHLSLAKSFAITERVKTTFTTEMSNLFNHPHYWDPDTWFQASDAGQLTWALPDNDPFKGGHRLISFKLRVEF
ncbi:MAG: TonB-dependent receptor domain-containing protein, partial [Acidobacteriaceae bacterium]